MNEITFEDRYRGYKINSDMDRGLGCHTKILDRYLDHFEDMMEKHARIRQVRFDLRVPQESSEDITSENISKFVNFLTKDIDRKNKMPGKGKKKSTEKFSGRHDPDPRIILAEEKNISKHHHIHGVVLINDPCKQSAHDIHMRIERQWGNALEISDARGLVDFCNKKGPSDYRIDRNDESKMEVINSATFQASYISKMNGKEDPRPGAWLVKGTRLPKKADGPNDEEKTDEK